MAMCGEGAGVVIVKPLADAVAARDPIRAVILATGSNSDGRTIGVSLPSEAAQAALLRSVYERAGVAADDLAFFEMHGTGTPAGDPVETAAVGRSLGANRREPLPIGSVKTNIGHLEPASGMAGLLKAALALDHGVVPATLHCESPNPRIDFAGLKLRLVREAEPIDTPNERRVAGVNSFGFGGTNAHVVLAAPPRPAAEAAHSPSALPPLLISAKTEASLRELAGGWRALLVDEPDERVPGLVRAAAGGRDHHRHRLAALGSDRAAIAASLERFLEDQIAPAFVTGAAVAESSSPLCFPETARSLPEWGARRCAPMRRSAPRSKASTSYCDRSLAGRSPNGSSAGLTAQNWHAPTLPSRCCSRSKSVLSAHCVMPASSLRAMSVTASARLPLPGPQARCSSPRPRAW